MNASDANVVVIPGYRLVRAIASSRVATVYQATQRSLERQAAVKVMNLPDESAITHFAQLLRTNARLTHPDIVDINHIGHTADGRLFYTMPLLLSSTLAQRGLSRRPLKVAALLRVVLGALDYAHRRGIVHGGIKPGNVLLDHREHPLLADFGVARYTAGLGLSQPDAAAYLSPEQARGQPPGQRSDLYSVGALAFDLLTGSPPFEGADAVATAVAQVEQPIPQLPRAMAAWQPWLDQALAKDPEQRFQNAQEMADALHAMDGRGAGVASPAPRLRLPTGRQTAIAGSIIVAAAVAIAGWATWRGRANPRVPARDLAAANPSAAATATSGQATLATPPTAGSVAALRDRIDALVAQADTQRQAGHLFTPRGSSAVEQYLTVLILDPGNLAATTGIDAMLATLDQRLDDAWRHRRLQDANTLLQQCDLLATHASNGARRRWSAARSELAHQVGGAVAAAANDHDGRKIAQLRPLATALPAVYPAGMNLADAIRQAETPDAGALMRDPHGPLLVYVPATPKAPAFAAGRDEVTVAQYTRFAKATHRRASGCLEAYNPLSRMRRLSWQSPGFVQGGDDPVVCVSWADANAYAAWLSQQTGAAYRLPSDAEWMRTAAGVPRGDPCELGNVDDVSRDSMLDNDKLHCNDGAAATAPVGRYRASAAGAYDMYGNVSEWLAGGASGSRTFRGLSWRDGNQHKPLGRKGSADANVGYTNVGFRVVRLIDEAHPTPARANPDR